MQPNSRASPASDQSPIPEVVPRMAHLGVEVKVIITVTALHIFYTGWCQNDSDRF